MIKTIKLPLDILKEAINVVSGVKREYADIQAEIAALPALDPVISGQAAIDARKLVLDDFSRKQKTISSNAESALKELQQRYIDVVNAQVSPSGADISGEHAADYELLKAGLITSADDLRKLAEAHPTEAFLNAVQLYADNHGWNDNGSFMNLNRAKSVRDMGMKFLADCESAVNRPSGYCALCVTYDGEIQRRVKEYGITEEYAASAY